LQKAVEAHHVEHAAQKAKREAEDCGEEEKEVGVHPMTLE